MRSVCSIITTASAPRGTTPPVAIAVAVPGATASVGAWPQTRHLAIEPQPARRGVARARGVGGAHRKSVDARAIEWRRIGRGKHVGGQHAAERGDQRHGFARKRREIEVARKARLRVLGRHHFEELLLARGGPHRVEQARRLGSGLAILRHGNGRISTTEPAGYPSLSGETSTQPSAAASAEIGK